MSKAQPLPSWAGSRRMPQGIATVLPSPPESSPGSWLRSCPFINAWESPGSLKFEKRCPHTKSHTTLTQGISKWQFLSPALIY